MIEHQRAAIPGIHRDRECEARVVGSRVEVARASYEAVGPYRRLLSLHPPRAQQAMSADAFGVSPPPPIAPANQDLPTNGEKTEAVFPDPDPVGIGPL